MKNELVEAFSLAAAWLRKHQAEAKIATISGGSRVNLLISYEDFTSLYSIEEAKTFRGQSFTEYQIEHGGGLLIISCYKEAK
jgi:predicted methyltransferase MtxX (methanogen marker protein 4)